MSELIKCSLCKGVGSFRVKNSKQYQFRYCNRCQGLGELNWIENIFGSKRILSKGDKKRRTLMIDYRKHRRF